MSALQTGEVQQLEDGTKLFSYRQPVPISSYLIALAAGNLESRVKKNNIKTFEHIYIYFYTLLFEIYLLLFLLLLILLFFL